MFDIRIFGEEKYGGLLKNEKMSVPMHIQNFALYPCLSHCFPSCFFVPCGFRVGVGVARYGWCGCWVRSVRVADMD
jgi:hypothetical protein